MTLKRYRQITAALAVLTVISLALTAIIWRQERGRPNVEVVFLDVGQGDGILIKTRYNQQILIDGGANARVLDRLGRHLPFFDRDLDLVIGTHPDADHVGGLISVLERYGVGLFLEPGARHSTEIYETLEKTLAQKQIPRRYAASRQRYDLGDNLFLDILYPDRSFVGQDLIDSNESSIVAKLTDGKVDYLFTADAPAAVEQKLLADYGDYLRSEVLKVGHHGSRTSSSEEFLDEVAPQAAVIQVGKNNRYGHPHLSVLRRLEARRLPILRNDEQGDITLASNGQTVELK